MLVKGLNVSVLGLLLSLLSIVIISVCFLIKREPTPTMYFVIDLEVENMSIYVFNFTYSNGIKAESYGKNVTCEGLIPYDSINSVLIINKNFSNTTKTRLEVCVLKVLTDLADVDLSKSIVSISTSGRLTKLCNETNLTSSLSHEIRLILKNMGFNRNYVTVEFLDFQDRAFYGFLGVNMQPETKRKPEELIGYLKMDDRELYMTSVIPNNSLESTYGIRRNVTVDGKTYLVMAQGVDCAGFKEVKMWYDFMKIQLNEQQDFCVLKNMEVKIDPYSLNSICLRDVKRVNEFYKGVHVLKGAGDFDKCMKTFDVVFSSKKYFCKGDGPCFTWNLIPPGKINFINFDVYFPFADELGLREGSTIADYEVMVRDKCFKEKTSDKFDCLYYIYGLYMFNYTLKLKNNQVTFRRKRSVYPEWIYAEKKIASRLKSQLPSRLMNFSVFLCLLTATCLFLTLFLVMSVKNWHSRKYRSQKV